MNVNIKCIISMMINVEIINVVVLFNTEKIIIKKTETKIFKFKTLVIFIDKFSS